MTTKSKTFSIKLDRNSEAVLRTLSEQGTKHSLRFFLIGATARDILLSLFNIPTGPRTRDIDFGIQVATWNEFQKFRHSLLLHGFTPSNVEHRLRHLSGLEIDIVPFGAVADALGHISWPPSHELSMSVIGYADAFNCAYTVKLESAKEVVSARDELQISSPEGLTILKLISWSEGPERRQKDAGDILLIVSNYCSMDNEERLILEHEDLTTVANFDTATAGARLLGRDIRATVAAKTKQTLQDILVRELNAGQRSRLTLHMLQSERRKTYEEVRLLLEHLQMGLEDQR